MKDTVVDEVRVSGIVSDSEMRQVLDHDAPWHFDWNLAGRHIDRDRDGVIG